MSEREEKRPWYNPVHPRCADAPKHLIEEMRESGIRIRERDDHKAYRAETGIPTGSPQYRKFVSLLAELPEPTRVDISLRWTRHGEEVDEMHTGYSSRDHYFEELFSCLPGLNPDHPLCECCGCCSVKGDARTIVEAAVRLVEDPPEEVPGAREVPEGHYVQTVEVGFRNVHFLILVFRKNYAALSAHPPVENRTPVHLIV